MIKLDEALRSCEEEQVSSMIGCSEADSKRRVEAARQLELTWQSTRQEFLGRVAIPERCGMSRVSLKDVVAMMTNKRVGEISVHNPSCQAPFGNPCPESSGLIGGILRRCWEFFNLTEEDEPIEWCRWGRGFWIARQYVEVGGWFSSERFAVTRLDSLRASIPYGVMLRVAELQREQVFDCFSVVAPEAMVEQLAAAPVDPVVVGSIYHRAYEPKDPDDRQGEAHYVVAQWI